MNYRQRSIAQGWLELESDPGLFTQLIEDFGVRGIEVEEIYDLQSTVDGPVFGFILLFKWLEGGRRTRRNPKFELSSGFNVNDDQVVNSIFFAHQKVLNSCATHAILSVLMNRKELDIGATLNKLKLFTNGMTPENKGIALNNVPELVLAHNRHARPNAFREALLDDSESERGSTSTTTATSTLASAASTLGGAGGGGGTAASSSCLSAATSVTGTTAGSLTSSGRWQETFHYASFLPIDNRLIEMDSLKPYPIDHGKIPDGLEWHQYFSQLLYDRIVASNESDVHEIRYNLMALVPRRLDNLQQKLHLIESNQQLLLAAIKSLVLAIEPDIFRRVFQMSSFSIRKKLSETEIMEAAQYLLLTECSDDNATSVTGNLDPLNDVSATGVVNLSIEPTEINITEQQPGTSTVGNVAELECVPPPTSNIRALMGSSQLDNFEIGRLAMPTGRNVSDASATSDVVDLSAIVMPTNSNNKAETSMTSQQQRRKVLRLRFDGLADVEIVNLKEAVECYRNLYDDKSGVKSQIEEQECKQQSFEIDDQRRRHDYEPFVTTFFQLLLNQNLLECNESSQQKRKKSTISRTTTRPRKTKAK